MSEKLDIELFRSKTLDLRSIRLVVREDGSVRIDAQDMGELVEQVGANPTTSFGSKWVAPRSPSLFSLY